MASSRAQAIDPREYRRGMVLGLTMAEIITILVFLLMLASTAVSLRTQARVTELQTALGERDSALGSVAKALEEAGTEVGATSKLVALLERGKRADAAEAQLQELRRDSSRSLEETRTRLQEQEAQAAALRAERDQLAAVVEASRSEARERLAAALEEARKAAGADTSSPDDAVVALLTRRVGEGAEVRTALAREGDVLRGQNEQLRRDIARFRGQGGSGLPYCWPTLQGQPEFMLRVIMRDSGVLVRDRMPQAQPGDAAWGVISSLPREELMSIQAFTAAVAPLRARGQAQRCLYAVEAVDETGATNKAGYKSLRGQLNTSFYVREVAR